MVLEQQLISKLIYLIKDAGHYAMYYYNSTELIVNYKLDNSPVTIADQMLSKQITSQLKELTPQIAIISEEMELQLNLKTLLNHDTYWLIDPIDGTKSFINKKGDFTINIALIVDKEPVFGMIYQPLKDILYYTGADGKAYKELNNTRSSITVNKNIDYNRGINIVIPNRALTKEAQSFIHSFNILNTEQVASSFKFCLVAEGKYDIYANFSEISTWDIAAGHAILLKAGGLILDKFGKHLKYSKTSLNNPHFVAFNLGLSEEYVISKLLLLSKY